MEILKYGKAICYSGYREGQRPGGEVPTKEQIAEDLELIIRDGYEYIRMYDPGLHAERVLEVIREKKLPLKCMLGVDSDHEVNNPDCPWADQHATEEELKANAERNDAQVEKLIALVKKYDEEIIAVAIGNENTPNWGAHMVPVERLIRHVKRVKEELDKPVSFCEGAGEWEHLGELAKHLDFISVHSYPLHCRIGIDEAIEYNKKDLAMVKAWYPDKQVIFTEVGWSTQPNDHMIQEDANLPNLIRYITELKEWIAEEKVLAFIFEMFDEPWKGSRPESSERNWGLYYVDRTPKW